MIKSEKPVIRATRAIIDLSAVSHNIAEIRKKIGSKRGLMAVVKADGYGHGGIEVGSTALRSGADCLGVALPEEGEQLRNAGIKSPILVLGSIQPEEAYKVISNRLEQAVSGLDLAEALDRAALEHAARVNIHLKIDTGMGRIGLKPEDVMPFIKRLNRFRNIDLKGVFSHFACADESDKAFSFKQIKIFNKIIGEIEASGIKIPKKHMANSAGVLDLPGSYYDLVRPGIMIYGLYPSQEVMRSVKLKPAMTLRSKISHLQLMSGGTPVSYGRTFYTRGNSLVATLPLGYADGYSRQLSNQGYVMVKGQRAPLIGRVCMDMCMIDVSKIKDVQPGDDVTVFGDDPSVDDIAGRIGSINYEVVCSVGKRVPRIFLRSYQG